jgi:CRP-like cAMP-binding protein/RsiW-degrading membrane proteinase PrsW (M82 family)
MLVSIAIALLPVPVFYAIYFRHFIAYYLKEQKNPAYLKHLEAFLFGIAIALFIIIASPLINSVIKSSSLFTEAFIKAAIVEKLGAFIAIYLIQKHYRAFNALEAIISGILAGIGFSLVENIFYSINYGESVIMVRTLFSVPLHLTTCGLMGYYIGISNLSSTRFERVLNTLKALTYPAAVHGLFDFFLLMHGSFSYLIGPMIIIMVWTLEIFITRSKIIPARDSLKEQKLRLEDWMIKYRQPRYDRWILNSMGTSSSEIVPFFAANRGKILWGLVAASLITGGLSFIFRQNITGFFGMNLKIEEQILVMSVYPVSIGLILSIVGSINSKFFTSSVVSLPVIFEAVIYINNTEQYYATFDITHANCFINTSESLNTVNKVKAFFELKDFKSPLINLQIIWENHLKEKKGEPAGAIAEIVDPGIKFYIFLFKYYIFRLRKGIAFNLKLPGFQSIRGLFMQPGTVMQKEILYQPGAIVFRQGDENNKFYYIKKGLIDVYKEPESGEKIHIDTIEKGQIFNEMALLGNKQRTVTAECRTECLVAEADADNLEALIRFNPDFAYALVQKLAQRADQTQNYLSKTIEYLRDLVDLNHRKTKNMSILLGMALGQPGSNKDISFELNIEDLSKLLNINQDDIIEYINSSLDYKEINNNKAASSKLKNLDKALSSFYIKLNKKNEKLVISFSLKELHK